MGSAVRTVEPDAEPITLDVAKQHLRLEDLDAHDELIQSVYIPSARRDVETFIHRALITQTWVYRLNQFPPSGAIALPWPPLQSVTSVQYVDSNGTTQTWDSDEYVVDTSSTPGRITPGYGYSYPTARGHLNDVTITYVAGYGTKASHVPADIRHAMLLMIGDAYDRVQNAPVPGEHFNVETVIRPAQNLLSPYVVPIF